MMPCHLPSLDHWARR